MASGTTTGLERVWGSGPTDVFTVAASGTILQWNGSTWSPMASGTTVWLSAVWAAGDVFAVGGLGTILRRPRACLPAEAACGDGEDDDCDGRIDCADADCVSDATCAAGGLCAGLTAIACGATATGTTVGGPSRIDAYACDPWLEMGRESVYRVVPPTTGPVTATLTGLAKDLDLVVLAAGAGGGCETDQTTCLGASSTSGAESVTFTAQAGQPYYLVVDGYAANAGAFTLSVSCP